MAWWALRGRPDFQVYVWSVSRDRDEVLVRGSEAMLVELDISDDVGERILAVNAARAEARKRACDGHQDRVAASEIQRQHEVENADAAWLASRRSIGPLKVKA